MIEVAKGAIMRIKGENREEKTIEEVGDFKGIAGKGQYIVQFFHDKII